MQADNFLAKADVQEFVGAMGVGMRAQHAGDDELGLGEGAAQHGHEGDRAAFALERHRLAEGGQACLVQRGFQPGREGGRVPAIIAARHVEYHLGVIGRIFFQRRLQGIARLFRVQRGRQAHAESLAVE